MHGPGSNAVCFSEVGSCASHLQEVYDTAHLRKPKVWELPIAASSREDFLNPVCCFLYLAPKKKAENTGPTSHIERLTRAESRDRYRSSITFLTGMRYLMDPVVQEDPNWRRAVARPNEANPHWSIPLLWTSPCDIQLAIFIHKRKALKVGGRTYLAPSNLTCRTS